VAGLSAPRGAAEGSPATPPGRPLRPPSAPPPLVARSRGGRSASREPRHPSWSAAGATAAPVSDKICS
jgi:hypothetical protein